MSISNVGATSEQGPRVGGSCSFGDDSHPNELIRMGERIKIERYAVEIDPKNPTKTVVYAIAGKKRYQMPDAYREMYTDDYLEIESRTLERPELFEASETHFIPRRTAL